MGWFGKFTLQLINMTLFLIGKITGFILVAVGFLHFLVMQKFFSKDIWYERYRWWIGKVIAGLTVITFGCGLIILIQFILQR
jgi:integral membrane sensor domain MASE1